MNKPLRKEKKAHPKLPKSWGKMADGSVFGEPAPKKEYCEVQREWLEGLAAAVRRTQEDKSIKGEAVNMLIGYASSAETLLKYL